MKIEKKTMTREDLATYKDCAKKYNASLGVLSDRMNYIIRYIFGDTLHWWDWRDDGDSGGPKIHDDYIEYYGNFRGGDSKASIIDKEGSELDLKDGIPLRWLWEDFEEEYARGLALYKKTKEEQEALKIQKTIENKAKKNALAQQAKCKLTKEELKALLS